MKLLAALAAAVPAAAVVLAAGDERLPASWPRSVLEFRAKHPYDPPYLTERHDGSRHLVTVEPSHNDSHDVSEALRAGLRAANHGGTLYLPANQVFLVAQPLDLTFLNDVHVRLDGEIRFTNDTAYWQRAAYRHPFQNTIMFWKWGGRDVKIYGKGVLNGNGQRWWNEFAGHSILDPTNTYLRPVLFYAENATNLQIEGIHMKDSPCWTNFIVSSSKVSYSDVIVTAESKNASAQPKNTDFFDSLNVDHVSVKRVWVNIGDDCFSPKSNATDVHVDTMYCNATHGQSMGSIGQYAGEKSIIQDVLIENVWMLNGQHGARLKSWAGPNVGYGFMNNITFRNFWLANTDDAAALDSCYFSVSKKDCDAFPSHVNVTNVLFENFSGYTSGKNGQVVASFQCSNSPTAVCANITLRNFTVTSPCQTTSSKSSSKGSGRSVILCEGIPDGVGNGVNCYHPESDEAVKAKAEKCTVPIASLPEPTPWLARQHP